MPALDSLSQRWRLLVPSGAVVVNVGPRGTAVRQVRALPPGTAVALVGGRRLRPLARRAGLRVRAEYVALPSLANPVAITQVEREPLRWSARSVLAVPSGVTGGGHAVTSMATRMVRRAPRLLRRVPAGDRLLVGTRS